MEVGMRALYILLVIVYIIFAVDLVVVYRKYRLQKELIQKRMVRQLIILVAVILVGYMYE